jgi:hypothetical protein
MADDFCELLSKAHDKYMLALLKKCDWVDSIDGLDRKIKSANLLNIFQEIEDRHFYDSFDHLYFHFIKRDGKIFFYYKIV